MIYATFVWGGASHLLKGFIFYKLENCEDANSEVRGTAACNLGEIHDIRSVPHLINLVRYDKADSVRYEALSALDNYRSPDILDCLISEVYREKKSRRPRQIAAQQLQEYNEEKSVDALIILLLQDEDVYVRIFAADSLLILNRPKLRDWKQALDDESTYVIEMFPWLFHGTPQ